MAKRHRSPAYPALKISDAMKRVKQFYEAETINASPVKVAVTHWGYGEKSSGGLTVIASLKAYGFLNDVGAGGNRMVSLTQDALNYVYDTRDDPSERNIILANAVLKPKILRELFEKYPNPQVSDGSLDFYLKQQGYNPNAISDIIKVYRDALNYVDESVEPIADENEHESGNDEIEERLKQDVTKLTGNMFEETGHSDALKSSGDKNMKQDTFNIEEGQIVLQFPVEMALESFEDFTDWLVLQHRKIGRSVEGDNKPKLDVKD